MTRIALLGLGLMGRGMAGRLLEGGFPLTVYNRTRSRCEGLAARGARIAATPGEACEDAEVALSMVADDEASRAVWTGDGGALAAVPRGAVLIESSTLTVPWVKELAAAAAERGCDFLDAPVTGSRDQAAAGQLKFLVGGEAAVLDKVRPVLEAMGGSIIHFGPHGSGALVKLVNNGLCGVQAAALAEAVALIERSGVDVPEALSVLTNGAPGSPLVKAVSGRMSGRAYDPHFVCRLMAKDLGYALGEGQRNQQVMKTVAAALEVFRCAVGSGFGDSDFSAVVEQFRSG